MAVCAPPPPPPRQVAAPPGLPPKQPQADSVADDACTKLLDRVEAIAESLDTKLDRVDAKLESRLDRVEAMVESLDAKLDRVEAKLDSLSRALLK